MYVCICNGFRESQIRGMARAGLRCAEQVYRSLGAEPNCGCCLDLAQLLIDETHDEDKRVLAQANEPVAA